MGQLVEVAALSQIREGGATIVSVLGREIALFKVEGDVFATGNTCPHMGGPIGEGIVRGALITCPWHDWSFEIKTGICTINPAAALETYKVHVEGDHVFLEL